jgi:hypothetical protein
MEKIKKMGDGECCPEGEICEEPEVEPSVELTPEERVARSKQYVNPYEIPYVPSSHVKELIERANKKEQKLKIVQKRK